MIVQRGFKAPSSYHVDRLRAMPVGYFYDVITNGFGAMADYAAQVPPADRWAIAAYVRTLQYSQYAPAADVPPDKRAELERSLAAAPAPEETPLMSPRDAAGPRRARSPRAAGPARGGRLPARLRGRLRARPRPVPPLLALRLPVLGRHRGGLARPRDAEPADGRPVGRGAPPLPRGGGAHDPVHARRLPAGPPRHRLDLPVGGTGGGGGRGAPEEGGVPQRAVLRLSRALTSRSGPCSRTCSPLVAPAGRRGRQSARRAPARPVGHRPRDPLGDDHLRRDRLGHDARAPLVLDNLRRALHRRLDASARSRSRSC